ncbi:YceI family protein [Streptomyces sp. NPDC041068]|uniref:YceI family protein n=1 Tax=Streptomyces sp. NPDC041068 TaxID=3155130 RepID=UPI0033E3BB41
MDTTRTTGTGPLAAPEAGTYDIDTTASAVRFRTRSVFGIVPVRGTFGLARGTVVVADPVEESTVDVTIRTDTFDSGLRRRDRHVLSADYLDAATYPEIAFRAHGLRRAEQGAVLEGELTVHGVTGTVAVTVDSSVTEGRRLRVRGTATIDRYAFGVTKAKGMTGRRLRVDLDVHATR